MVWRERDVIDTLVDEKRASWGWKGQNPLLIELLFVEKISSACPLAAAAVAAPPSPIGEDNGNPTIVDPISPVYMALACDSFSTRRDLYDENNRAKKRARERERESSISFFLFAKRRLRYCRRLLASPLRVAVQ